MKPLTIIIVLIMMSLACKQTPNEEKPDPKKEITQVLLDFQELINNSGFTYIFILASEEPSAKFYTDTYYNQAIKDGRITEDTDILVYATKKILDSDLISEEFKNQIRKNREKPIDFSMWKHNATIGAVLTNSEFGLDFMGVTFWDIATREDAEMVLIDHERYQNGFAPNPDSIMMSYDLSPDEVYPHFIEITSPKTASYYVNSKLIKVYGTAPRFIMDFVFSVDKGWQIDNMYYDDYKGNILKEDSDFSD